MNFLSSFRVKLLIILAILLIATIGIQYYLNLRSEAENERLRETQEQATLTGFTLGISSMSSSDRLATLAQRGDQSFFDKTSVRKIEDILVINNDWLIYDSLNPKFLPTTDSLGNTQYLALSSVTDLPPLLDANRLGEDRAKFPNATDSPPSNPESEAHAIPIETDQGRWYVMVVLRNEKSQAFFRTVQPLFYTLAVLLVSTMAAIYLVWRFTRPIANLASAARSVAQGDLTVRVPDDTRTDEIGKLAARFNEMTAQLEQKRFLEEKLAANEKSAVVGRLASAIAHEIRNPLNYINLTLDHLSAKFTPEENPRREQFLNLTSQLKDEVARINRQVSDFLRYSRPIKLSLQPIAVHEVINDSLRIVEAQAKEQNVKIGIVERENVSKISGDAEALRSVFNNLFINALQAMESHGGNLSVTISPDSDFVKIDVADTGTGIPLENLPKIFEPYFSTKETGTGLGLAIVKRIVEDHSGKVGVESGGKSGTKFIVLLPVAPASKEEA